MPHLGPRWNGKPETFITYKHQFTCFIDGIDPYLKSILENGPYIPFVVTPAVATATGAPGTSKITPKVRDQLSDEDRRLVHLDTRLQNLVLASVPERMVTALLKYRTTKAMWDGLVSQM